MCPFIPAYKPFTGSKVQAISLECSFAQFLSKDTSEHLNIQVETWSSVLDISPKWNQLIPENHCLRVEKLALLEQSNLPEMAFYYQLILKDGLPLAAFYYQLFLIEGKHYHDFSQDDSWASRNFSRLIRSMKLPMLVCGNLICNESPGFYLGPDFRTMKDASHFINKTFQLARKQSSASMVLVKDLDTEMLELLTKDGDDWMNPGEDIVMKLNIRPEWKTFADYTACLSQKYAARIRKIEKTIHPVTVKTLGLEEMIALAPQIESLYQQVATNASVKMGSINANYLISQKALMPEDVYCKGWFENEELIAFSQQIKRDQKLEISYVGMNQEQNRKYSLYHHILLDGLRDAIQFGCAELYLGRTAYEAKAILGCKPETHQNRILIPNPVIRTAARRFFQWFDKQRGEEWKKRNPFRDAVIETTTVSSES